MCEEKGKGVKETTKEEATAEKSEEEGIQISNVQYHFTCFSEGKVEVERNERGLGN